MSDSIQNLIHGRETYIADFGPNFVIKRPLPTFGPATCDDWLRKQQCKNRLYSRTTKQDTIC